MKKSFIQLISMLLVLACLVTAFASCEIALTPPKTDEPGENGGSGNQPGDDPGENPGENPGEEPGGDPTDDPEDPSSVGFTVVINEASTNNTLVKDPTDNQSYDWIELYNSGDEDFVLTGYGISDRDSKIKHVFDSTAVVPAKGFLVLWACGSDAMAGKSETGVYLPFSLSKNGESIFLFSKRGVVLDSLEVPALKNDTTYGYVQDGSGALAKLSPTCGTTNSTATVLTLSDTVANFSKEAGFYDEAFTLTLSLPEGYKAYYTLDCTSPTTSSPEFPAAGLQISDASVNPNKYANQYTGKMEIVMYESYSKVYGVARDLVDKCTVLRVVVYAPDGKSTNVITKNYFVGANFDDESYEDISVVCLTGEPSQLFGMDGLFTNPNYSTTNRDKIEREVNFSYFSAKHNYKFDQTIGIRLHGTSTPQYNQKSMTLFARGKYGNGAFEQAVVGSADVLRSMVLRTDGTTKLQEGFLTSFISDTAVQTADYKPCVVFIDGEYYGVFNLYERICEDYFEENYGVDKDNIYLVKKGSDENVSGAASAWYSTYNWMCTANMTTTANWNKLNTLIDVQSLIDLIAAETYICNADWSLGSGATNPRGQNFGCWRVIDSSKEDPDNPYGDGRWRFIMYDLDISAGAYKAAENRANASAAVLGYNCTPDYNGFTQKGIWTVISLTGMPIWNNLIRNNEFKARFVQAFTAMCEIYYKDAGTRIEEEIQRYSKWMPKHFDRFGIPVTAWEVGSKQSGTLDADWKPKTWFGGLTSRPAHITKENYIYEMQRMQDFFDNHATYAMEDMYEVLGLTGTLCSLEILCDSSMGNIYFGEALVPISEGEDYFYMECYKTYPFTFSVEAKEGYVFTGWKTTSTGTLSSNTSTTTTLTITGSARLTAQFAKAE